MDGFPKINSTEFAERMIAMYFDNNRKHFDTIRNFIVTLQEGLVQHKVYTSSESSSSEESDSDGDQEWEGDEGVVEEPEVNPNLVTEQDARDTISFTDYHRVDVIQLYQFLRNMFECTHFSSFVSFNHFYTTNFDRATSSF